MNDTKTAGAVVDDPDARGPHSYQSADALRPRQNLLACAAIIILATVVTLPIFLRGFPAGFDAVRHYRWTSQFIEGLRDGACYPRWLPGANDGQGSPVTLYYPPLSFYVAAGLSPVAGNTLRAISLSCWLAMVLSGLTMYAFGRSLLPPGLSFTAAALYMTAPYHLLDLYQGSTVSEFWSFVWVPLLLDAVRRVSGRSGFQAVVYLALSYALILFTHLPVLLLTSLTLVIFAVSLTRKPRVLLRIAAGLILGTGIGAVFLIPVLFEARYIRLFFKFDYRDYFAFEHLRAALTSGRFPAEPSLSSYSSDIDLVAAGILALLLVSSLLIVINRRSVDLDSRSKRVCLAICVATAFAMLMTTRLTALLWWLTPGLSFLFFPYRWLVVVSAGTCLLAALSGWIVMRGGKGRVLQICALAVVVMLNLVISAIAVWRAPQSADNLQGGLSRRDTREYRPVWWNGQLHQEEWQTGARVERGDADVRAIDDAGIERAYTIAAGAESVIALRPLYFPGWILRIDGKQTQIAPTDDGHIQFHVEPGEHIVTLRFEDTWPRTAGKVVSAASLAIILLMFFVARRRAP